MILVDLECGTCGLRWSGRPGAQCPVGHAAPDGSEPADPPRPTVEDTPGANRVAALETALRGLVARVRRTGGYASPEEQAALWEAERVLGGGA